MKFKKEVSIQFRIHCRIIEGNRPGLFISVIIDEIGEIAVIAEKPVQLVVFQVMMMMEIITYITYHIFKIYCYPLMFQSNEKPSQIREG